METTEMKETLVACHSLKTSLNRIKDEVGVTPEAIYKELAKQGIAPIGSQIWDYNGCDDKPDTVFDLNICVPVAKAGKDTDFIKFVNLSEMKGISYTHNGPWSEFGIVYGKLIQDIFKNGLKPNGRNREVYINCDFENPSKCITEILIAIE